MTFNKMLIATALAAPAVALAAPAQAQVSGIASANPIVAMGNSKAFTAANQQIQTMFKSNLDQADAKEKARQTALAQLDKNGDKNVDQAELDQAEAAKSPALAQAAAAEREIATLTEPAVRAQAYSIERMLQGYDAALRKVVTDKKVSVVLSPESFVFAPPAVDITTAITTEMDKAAPAAVTAPPSGWNPSRQTLAIQQQLQQFEQYKLIRAAQQQQAQRQPGAAAPAPGARPPAQPAARPAASATPPQQPPGR